MTREVPRRRLGLQLSSTPRRLSHGQQLGRIMGFRERLRAAADAFWGEPQPPKEGEWPGYCMLQARCILDAGHSGRCEWL